MKKNIAAKDAFKVTCSEKQVRYQKIVQKDGLK